MNFIKKSIECVLAGLRSIFIVFEFFGKKTWFWHIVQIKFTFLSDVGNCDFPVGWKRELF